MKAWLMVALRGAAPLLVCFWAGGAQAWEQSKSAGSAICLAWQERAIPWSPASPLGGDLAEAEFLRVIRRSFDAWQTAGCSDVRFAETAPVPREVGFVQGKRNDNVLLLREERCSDVVPKGDRCLREHDCAEKFDCWEHDDNLIGVTTVTYSSCSGQILDADIELNGAGFRFTVDDGPSCTSPTQRGCVSMDLQNTLVHEIGHLIGLDHSRRPDAAMYANASLGETNKRSLSDDDRQAICAVYPEGEGPRTCGGGRSVTECRNLKNTQGADGGGCSASGATGSVGAILAAAGIAIGSFVRRPARRWQPRR